MLAVKVPVAPGAMLTVLGSGGNRHHRLILNEQCEWLLAPKSKRDVLFAKLTPAPESEALNMP